MGNFNRILSTLILFLFQAYTLKFQNGTVTVKETRRSLPTAIDSAKSGFFGNGVGVGELYTPLVATVQAKDASGVNITTGGDLLAISITNECTITGYLE